MPQRPATPGSLLCERCGYPLDTLESAALCPECAKPIAESLPTWRQGSAWQQRPGLAAFLHTTRLTLRRARPLFQHIRLVLTSRERWLLGIYICVAAILPAITWCAMYSPRHPAGRWWYMRNSGAGWSANGQAVTMEAFLMPWNFTGIVACAIGLAWVVLLLTWIETLGVRFFGARRGWRVSRTIAWAVCAHAAVGWVVGGLLAAAAPWFVLACRPLYDLLPQALAVRVATTAATWAPFAGFFAGMLAFETLVYIGIRECRFANEPAASASISPSRPG